MMGRKKANSTIIEYFDVCDEFGEPTGDVVSREKAHKEGICHRTVFVWIIRKHANGWDALLQQRSYDKDSFPGLWDVSCAGHVMAGDNPLDSACRELQEELGIVIDRMDLEYIGRFQLVYSKIFHEKIFKDNEIGNVYVYRRSLDIEDCCLQVEEVASVKWKDLQELYHQCEVQDQKYCVPFDCLKLLWEYVKGS